MFYSKLESVAKQRLQGDAILSWATSMQLLALRELATNCIILHAFDTSNTDNSPLLNFPKSKRLKIAGS